MYNGLSCPKIIALNQAEEPISLKQIKLINAALMIHIYFGFLLSAFYLVLVGLQRKYHL